MFSKELLQNSCFQQLEEWEEHVRYFFKKLCQLISIKRKEKLSVVTYGIRYKISFALLRSCLLCTRGSRKSNDEYEKQNEKLIYSSIINTCVQNTSMISFISIMTVAKSWYSGYISM